MGEAEVGMCKRRMEDEEDEEEGQSEETVPDFEESWC